MDAWNFAPSSPKPSMNDVLATIFANIPSNPRPELARVLEALDTLRDYVRGEMHGVQQ